MLEINYKDQQVKMLNTSSIDFCDFLKKEYENNTIRVLVNQYQYLTE